MEVIPFLAIDPDDVVHELGSDLDLALFDHFADFAGVIRVDAVFECDLLAHDAPAGGFWLAVLERQRGNATLVELRNQNVIQLAELVFVVGQQSDALLVVLDLAGGVFEVKTARQLFAGNVHGVFDFLKIEFRSNIERRHIIE